MKLSRTLLLLSLPAATFGLFPSVSLAQKKMTFSGHLANMQNLSCARLRFEGESVQLDTDSVAIVNGDFTFKGMVSSPVLADLVIEIREPGAQMAETYYERYLYLEPGKIKLSSADSLKNVVIKGSALNDDFSRFHLATKPASEQITALKTAYYSASDEDRQSEDFQQRVKDENARMEMEFRKLQLEFIAANPQSLVSLDALISYASSVPDAEGVETLFDGFSASVKESPKGKIMAAQIESTKTTAIGNLAPDFTLPDTSGKAVALHDFKGKYVLVDFWASWCGPCRKENPNVVKYYNAFKPKGFTVLGVSLDRQNGKIAWINAINSDGLTWTQVSDLKYWDSEVAKQYNIRAIPQNFLIDPSGRIIARNLRGKDLENKLNELFKN